MFAEEAQLHANLTKYVFVFAHIRDLKQSNLAGKIIELTVLWNLGWATQYQLDVAFLYSRLCHFC